MAGLTKQHFNKFAEIINKSKNFPIEIRETNKPMITNIDLIAREFADYFATQNPLFNRNQFLKECLK